MAITRRDFLTNSTLAGAGIFLKKPMSVFQAIANGNDQWYLPHLGEWRRGHADHDTGYSKVRELSPLARFSTGR